ncbi:MAG: branched-chain amino acid ABC transporter permease [Conexivisphaerales archaeon]
MKGPDFKHLNLQSIKNISFIIIIGVIVLSVVVFISPFTYLDYVLMYFFAFAIFAISWDFLYSYSGQLSLGHAIPFGIGAFTVAILASKYQLNPVIGLFIAPFTASLIGGLIGMTTIRLKPAYQGIALLLFSQVLYWFTLLQFSDEGISFGYRNGLPVLGFNESYFIGILVFIVGSISILLIEHSKIRLKLLAIKQDSFAAYASGINVTFYKIFTLFVSSFFAGLGGGFLALYTFHTDYTIFLVSNDFLPIAMSIVGGTQLLGGVLLGSLLISFLDTILPAYVSLAVTYLIYGILVILVLRIFPEGIKGIIKKIRVT